MSRDKLTPYPNPCIIILFCLFRLMFQTKSDIEVFRLVEPTKFQLDEVLSENGNSRMLRTITNGASSESGSEKVE
ncbi:hypothetical protein J6590_099796, partial [Homalodisca vitripennis]